MIQILDCTLRDGGYINDWTFGEHTNFILDRLYESKVDIIEHGFLTIKDRNKNQTLYNNIGKDFDIVSIKDSAMNVVMINQGEFDCSYLPIKSHDSKIDGIRIAFHKQDLNKALLNCQAAKERGYKVFIQPMISLSYTDEEFIKLIQLFNLFEPYAFYIVDSFGAMFKKDLIHYFDLIDEYLNEEVRIGYHGHNNLQQAFSNAQEFCSIVTERNLICDSSIYGMGRGAGNLNTELFMTYLNTFKNKNYNIVSIIQAIDNSIMDIFNSTPWGYSLEQFMSATKNCHPNYASFLMNKRTLSQEKIMVILNRIPPKNRNDFDKILIEKLYTELKTGDNN